MISIKNGSDKTEIIKKDPMSRPDYAGEETGPCPVCGHSILTPLQEVTLPVEGRSDPRGGLAC